MIGRREICGLGTLGVTASLALIGHRITFARAVKDDATASSGFPLYLYFPHCCFESFSHTINLICYTSASEIGCLHIVD